MNENSTDAVEDNIRTLEDKLDKENHKLEVLELKLERAQLSASNWRNPIVVAIFAATAAAFGNAAVTVVDGILLRSIETYRAEAARLLEALKTEGDRDLAAENLDFLEQIGLISDPDLRANLREYLDQRPSGTGPALGAPAQPTPVVSGAEYTRLGHRNPVSGIRPDGGPIDQAFMMNVLSQLGNSMLIENSADADENQYPHENPSALPIGYVFFGMLVSNDLSYIGNGNYHLGLSFIYENVLNLTARTEVSGDHAKIAETYSYSDLRYVSPHFDYNRYFDARVGFVNPVVLEIYGAFARLHNQLVDELRAEGVAEEQLFDQARFHTRLAYQSLILNDYLPRVTNEIALEERMSDLSPFLPVEWVGALRYVFLSELTENLPLADGGSWSFSTSHDAVDTTFPQMVNLSDYFQIEGQQPIVAPALDTRIDRALAPNEDWDINFVAQVIAQDRLSLELPSGQQLARALHLPELPQPDIFRELGISKVPLFYYLLLEAEINENGERLGPMGTMILTDAVFAALNMDRNSISYNERAAAELGVDFSDVSAFLGEFAR